MQPSVKKLNLETTLALARRGLYPSCYEGALTIVLHHNPNGDLLYVEGLLRDEINKRPVMHSWIESPDEIFDPFNARKLFMIKGLLPFPQYFPVASYTPAQIEERFQVAKTAGAEMISLPFADLENHPEYRQ